MVLPIMLLWLMISTASGQGKYHTIGIMNAPNSNTCSEQPTKFLCNYLNASNPCMHYSCLSDHLTFINGSDTLHTN